MSSALRSPQRVAQRCREPDARLRVVLQVLQHGVGEVQILAAEDRELPGLVVADFIAEDRESELQGPIQQGWALVEQGQGEVGIAQTHQGLAALRATGREEGRPYYLALLTEAYGKEGQAEEGLRALAAVAVVSVALVLQVSVFSHLSLAGVVPNLCLLVVVAAALTRGPQFAAVLGFVAGVALDLAPPADHIAGRWALALVVVVDGAGSSSCGHVSRRVYSTSTQPHMQRW